MVTIGIQKGEWRLDQILKRTLKKSLGSDCKLSIIGHDFNEDIPETIPLKDIRFGIDNVLINNSETLRQYCNAKEYIAEIDSSIFKNTTFKFSLNLRETYIIKMRNKELYLSGDTFSHVTIHHSNGLLFKYKNVKSSEYLEINGIVAIYSNGTIHVHKGCYAIYREF